MTPSLVTRTIELAPAPATTKSAGRTCWIGCTGCPPPRPAACGAPGAGACAKMPTESKTANVTVSAVRMAEGCSTIRRHLLQGSGVSGSVRLQADCQDRLTQATG